MQMMVFTAAIIEAWKQVAPPFFEGIQDPGYDNIRCGAEVTFSLRNLGEVRPHWRTYIGPKGQDMNMTDEVNESDEIEVKKKLAFGDEILVSDDHKEYLATLSDRASHLRLAAEELAISASRADMMLWEKIHELYPEVNEYGCTYQPKEGKIVIRGNAPSWSWH